MLCLYGGVFLAGLVQAIQRPDLARIMGINMSKGLMKFTIVVASLLIVFGFAMLSSNLLAMSSVLQ